MANYLSNVVEFETAKVENFDRFLTRTVEDVYSELTMLRNRVECLNSEINRLRAELKDYE